MQANGFCYPLVNYVLCPVGYEVFWEIYITEEL